MNIKKDYKLEEVTSRPKDNRGVLESIYVYKNGTAWAVATNGKALAKVPVTLEGKELDNGNSIKAHDFKFQRSNPALKQKDEMFCFLQPLQEQYPNFEMVFPKESPVVTIGLDVSLLMSLCKAIGTTEVKLEIIDGMKAVKVSSLKDQAHGLIMPIRMQDNVTY